MLGNDASTKAISIVLINCTKEFDTKQYIVIPICGVENCTITSL